MEKIKNFFNKYGVTIISTLVAISSLFVAMEGFGGQVATVCTVGVGIVAILIAIVKAILSALKSGFDETTIKLIVNAIALIRDMINGVYAENETNENTNDEVKSAKKNVKVSLSKEEIRELITK